MPDFNSAKRVLIIEDSESKYRDVLETVRAFLPANIEISRAGTIEEADDAVAQRGWDLICLDVSLDIRSSSAGPRAGGHDAIGGLKILERMYLLNYDAPVIVITAFDAFPPGDDRTGVVLGIEEVLREAKRFMGALVVGHVSYGANTWRSDLECLFGKVLEL